VRPFCSFARGIQFPEQVRKEVRAETDMRLEDLARGFDLRAAELAELRAHHSRKVRTGDITAQARLAKLNPSNQSCRKNEPEFSCANSVGRNSWISFPSSALRSAS